MTDSVITVMQVLAPPAPGREVSNPYTRLLVASMPSGRVKTVYFNWRSFLTDSFDVLHVHWPEVLIRHPRRVIRWLKSMLLLVFILRLRLQRKAIVRTVHNLKPHETGDAIERLTLRVLDRTTTMWLVLNEATPVPSEAPTALIPHGHYRDWYHEPSPDEVVRGRLLAFGLIRAYKGMDDLVESFIGLSDRELSLHIAGKPDSAETSRTLREKCDADHRISLDLRFIPDKDLIREIGQAEMVILPYREVHNSGVALLALSMNRPIILRSSSATQLLVDEFGEEWVVLFEGELTARTLERSIERTRSFARGSRVDMETRNWQRLASHTVDAYVRAVSLARR